MLRCERASDYAHAPMRSPLTSCNVVKTRATVPWEGEGEGEGEWGRQEYFFNSAPPPFFSWQQWVGKEVGGITEEHESGCNDGELTRALVLRAGGKRRGGEVCAFEDGKKEPH